RSGAAPRGAHRRHLQAAGMNPARLFVWTAAMVVAAFVVPQGAPLLGMDPPLTIVAAPAAGAIAGLFQAPWNPRWPRAQALAAAWAALGALLPFPRWAAAAFMVGAAVISAWGIAGHILIATRGGTVRR